MCLLETTRLVLTPFKKEEGMVLHQLFTDPFIRKYLWDDEILQLSQCEEVLQQSITHFEQDRWGLWKIQEKGEKEVMGFVGLWYFFEEPQPQLLYALLKKFSGQGYATEASKRIIDYAFKQLQFRYVIASMDEEHAVSQACARRIGMAFEETKLSEGKPTAFYKIENRKD